MKSRLLSGAAIGDLVVDDLLAQGGMAEIYSARRSGTGVVVKRIHPHLARDPEFVAMFEDEIRITSRLRHPGIARVLDVLRPHGEVLLVLERVQGVDLRAVLAVASETTKPLDPAPVLSCVHHVAEALAHVHGAVDDSGANLGIVHRDISPGNLMARRGGGACILDFGVARAASRIARTTGSVTKGKPAYLSPEQANLELVGPPSDVYQLGLVLFELLTGRRALSGRSPLELMRAASSPVPIVPSSIRRELAPDVDELVLAMQHIDPDARPSAAAIATALSGFRDHPGLAIEHVPASGDTRFARDRRDRAIQMAADLDESGDDTQPIRRT